MRGFWRKASVRRRCSPRRPTCAGCGRSTIGPPPGAWRSWILPASKACRPACWRAAGWLLLAICPLPGAGARRGGCDRARRAAFGRRRGIRARRAGRGRAPISCSRRFPDRARKARCASFPRRIVVGVGCRRAAPMKATLARAIDRGAVPCGRLSASGPRGSQHRSQSGSTRRACFRLHAAVDGLRASSRRMSSAPSRGFSQVPRSSNGRPASTTYANALLRLAARRCCCPRPCSKASRWRWRWMVLRSNWNEE